MLLLYVCILCFWQTDQFLFDELLLLAFAHLNLVNVLVEV